MRQISPLGTASSSRSAIEGEGTGLELRMFDAVTGDELDRSHGQLSAGVRACAGSSPRSVRVEARATAGKLEAVIGERIVARP